MLNRNDYILQNSLDARWFLALKNINRPLLLSAYTIGAAVLDREKQKVLADSSYNPTFEYQNLDGLAIKTAKNSLLNLREELWQEESKQSIRDAYIEKINEALLEMDMLSATNENRWSDFTLYNEKKYGQINPEIISGQISLLQDRYELFKDFKVNESVSEVPKMISAAKTAHEIFISGPDIDSPAPFYNASDICELWLKEIHKFSQVWKVVISDSSLHVNVNSRTRTILLPRNIRVSKVKMQTLFVHEIGTHVYRRELGKKTKLQLLSIGLANYQKAEEGIALVREQLVQEKYNQFRGFDKYLALTYARGGIDGKPKDFQQTFSMLRKYYSKRLAKKYTSADSERIALSRAWGSTVRIFRGGQPALPGCCFLRDKIYLEGNIYIWDLLNKSPQFFSNIYNGKFDPGVEQHRNLVAEFK